MTESRDYVNQLAEYVMKNLSKGYTIDSLKVALEMQGYSKISIGNAIKRANEEMSKKAPQMKEKPEITYRVLGENEEPEKQDIVYETTYVPESKRGFFAWLKGIFS
jgi:hypothetical protein